MSDERGLAGWVVMAALCLNLACGSTAQDDPPCAELADCDRILMNDVAHIVRWRGNPDVSRLAGQPIRLKIAMRSAKLYAFQFVND